MKVSCYSPLLATLCAKVKLLFSFLKTLKSSSSSSSSPSSLPTLPFDLISEILSRLPVKFLLQFQCVCKSWKSLISDPKFAKKHLTLSTTHTFHCVNYYSHNVILKSYSLDSVLINTTETQFPSPRDSRVFFVGSCNGMLCLVNHTVDLILVQLWNPSIRKFKELPSISQPQTYDAWFYGFGYDLISDNYKVVVVFDNYTCDGDDFSRNEVKVHTLGTDSWRSVSQFPFDIVSAQLSGQYLSGTINWLVFMGMKWFIASFDLGNECYREILLPDDSSEVDVKTLSLCVFRDCLCMIYGKDVSVMKEYGNKESWTKLFTISCMREPCVSSSPSIRAIRVFEDEQVLLIYRGDRRCEHIYYNCKNDTLKLIEFEENNPEVCVESLISPCF